MSIAATDISRNLSVATAKSTKSVDYVGFANFPNQVFRRCIKNGFDFTLMVVGHSGLGKSTFLNTLFLAEICDTKKQKLFEAGKTVQIQSKTVRLIENDVRMNLTVVDTPGFGDLVDNTNCWEPIVKFIDNKFSEYLTEETKIERPAVIPDRRVHLCLYFIQPTGHSLKPLDIQFLRALHDRVNIVPVIAKADTLTAPELAQFKQNILNDIKKYEIQLYEFPEPEPIAEMEKTKTNGGAVSVDYRRRVPFAVVGSNQVKEERNERGPTRKIRVREYPWGVVEVDNMAHNDFVPLRDMIIRNNMIDLIDVTKNVHYENFRIRNLPKNSFDNDPFTQLEQEMRERELEAQDSVKTKEKLFKEKVAAREQRLMERAQMMDNEERENRKVLDEKKVLLERLRQEIEELRRGGGPTTNGNHQNGHHNSAGINMSGNGSITGSGSSLHSNRTSPEKEKIKKKIGNLFARG